MVFRSREKRSLGEKVWGFLWPRTGWRRAMKYLYHRLARLPGRPYSIAGGFACGAAISFTPFVGLHFILSAILAWIIRTNVVAALLGTAVGNPWTFPFIWALVYGTGIWILGLDGSVAMEALSPDAVLTDPIATLGPVFWPMLVGSAPIGVLAWVTTYLPLRYLVAGYQERRHRRRAARANMTAAEQADNEAK